MKRTYWRKLICHIPFCLLSVTFALSLPTVSHAASGPKKLKLGTSFSVAAQNASYESSDEEIAYVNEEGLVTAKKRGKVTIRIKSGDRIRKRKVIVVANRKKKKGVKVCTGEMTLLRNAVTYSQVNSEVEGYYDSALEGTQGQEELRYHYSAVLEILNNGAEDASKVTMHAEIAGQDVTFSFGKVEAGGTSTARAEGEILLSQMPELEQIRWDELPEGLERTIDCQRLNVYSAGMYTSYDYGRQKTSYHWGTADTKAPVIKGFVGKNSFNQRMPYQVVYNDDTDYDFLQYVTASDDREGKVRLTVNTQKVNFQKTGIYKITYIARDKAGNVTRRKAKIAVRKKKTVDEIADKVLSVIIKKKWSPQRKAIAIYNYTRGHISYVGTSGKKGWEQEAVNGIRYGKGDCYTYYAVARALLTRAGIPNIEVKRYRGAGHHWWNMVYIGNGWYHYDCGPRIGGGRFCLLTDAQLSQYSRTHGNKYIWNYRKIPKSPKKKLTRIF